MNEREFERYKAAWLRYEFMRDGSCRITEQACPWEAPTVRTHDGTPVPDCKRCATFHNRAFTILEEAGDIIRDLPDWAHDAIMAAGNAGVEDGFLEKSRSRDIILQAAAAHADSDPQNAETLELVSLRIFHDKDWYDLLITTFVVVHRYREAVKFFESVET